MDRLNRFVFRRRSTAMPAFWLPLDDAGAGAVNTTPGIAGGSPTATFTRATIATTTLSTGLIAQVNSGVARSCYSPAGIYLGYLAEETRTNLALQSTFNGTWSVAGLTAKTVNATASPDGTVSAAKITEDATTAAHGTIQSYSKAGSALTYTFTCYLKQSERSWGILELNNGSTIGSRAWFNLATGVVGSIVALGAGFTSTSSSITPAANGFFRCTLTGTSDAALTLNSNVLISTGDTNYSYAGTANSGIFCWGAQLEQAAFATSYIPTTVASVVRNADALTYASAGNASVTVGTMYAEITYSDTAAITRYTSAISDGSLNNRVTIFNSQPGAAASMAYRVISGGAVQLSNVGTGTTSASATNKQALRWSVADATAYLNGAQDRQVTGPLTMPAAFSRISVGVSETALTGQPNACIKNFRVYNRAHTDAFLQSLTS